MGGVFYNIFNDCIIINNTIGTNKAFFFFPIVTFSPIIAVLCTSLGTTTVDGRGSNAYCKCCFCIINYNLSHPGASEFARFNDKQRHNATMQYVSAYSPYCKSYGLFTACSKLPRLGNNNRCIAHNTTIYPMLRSSCKVFSKVNSSPCNNP